MFTKDLTNTKYARRPAPKPINQRWLTPSEPNLFYRGGQRSLDIFNDMAEKRREKYPNWQSKVTTEAQQVSEIIEDKGYYRIENFWDIDFLEEIREETMRLIGEAHPSKVKYPQEGRHTQIVHPLRNIPLINKMATDERIQAIASAFLGAPPALGTTNLRLSTAERSENIGTNMFHKDFNSPVKLIKFFTYFNDVTLENGPFTYVESSNRQLPSSPNWSVQHRWPDDMIEAIYGKERIIYNTANYGDLLIATTNGFHKGLKLASGSRLMMTLNYVIHPELGGAAFDGPPQTYHTIQETTYNDIAQENQRLYDFMEKV